MVVMLGVSALQCSLPGGSRTLALHLNNKTSDDGVVACWVQTENEAAMQQMKRLKLEHAHSLHQLAQENAKLQRTLAHIQVVARTQT